MPQVWSVPVTNRQRLVLHELAFSGEVGPDGRPQPKRRIIDAKAGRVFRRMMRALGLDVINQVGTAHGGRLNRKAIDDPTPRLHEITAENLEEILEVLRIDRSPTDELVVGELGDLLEELRSSGAEYSPPEGLEYYTKDADRWTPASEPEEPLVCAKCGAPYEELPAKPEPAAAPPNGAHAPA